MSHLILQSVLIKDSINLAIINENGWQIDGKSKINIKKHLNSGDYQDALNMVISMVLSTNDY
ncbi:hypothetical protein EAI96_13015 [Turicibacter sanguinis]|nr:hypothetical protein EAI96_13015 [Turicibacter sanguinis]